MKHIITISILFVLLSLQLKAQDLTQTIRGVITDKDSKAPLAGATVQVLKTDPPRAAFSDEGGRFRIANVPVGRQSIRITYLGYNDVTLNDVIVNSAKEVVLNIEMQEKVIQAKEVVVKATAGKMTPNNELITVSGRSFTIDQTQRYAGSLGDPSRMASSFAGVASSGSDQRNDIVIRGNSPLGLLWRFEGADIPNPNHFSNQGANGGPVSILNNNVLMNSDFLTGAFPAEYGNGASGVFDLKMRSGNNEKHEYMGQMGFNGVEAMAEGPINKVKGSSYLINYRYSTLALFNKIGFTFGDAGVPNYQDLSFKFNFPKTKLGSFSLFGIGGTSSTQLNDIDKDAKDLAKEPYPSNIDFGSKMGVAGLSHIIRINKSSYVKTVLSVSGESNSTKLDTLNYNSHYEAFNTIYRKTSTTRQSVHSYYSKKFNTRSSMKLGVIATNIRLNMIDTSYDADIKHYRVNYDFTESTGLLQSYANFNYRATENLTLNAGLHYNHLLLNNTSSIEPRAGMKWKFAKRQSLNLGFGVHGQIQPMPVYFQRTLDTLTNTYSLTDKNLKMTKSFHYVIGYENQLGENLYLKTEAYYQYLTHIPVEKRPTYFSVANFGADFYFPWIDSLTNTGVGRNYGFEVTLERYFSDGYYFLLTSSIYDSKYKGSDNVWRNTAFNGRFVYNALAGKEIRFKEGKKILTFSGKLTWAGGKRYVPIDLLKSATDHATVYDEANAYKPQYQDYFRADVRIGFKKNGKHITQEWALDIQNVFNVQNVLYQQFNPRTGQIEKSYQIGIFPVPLYRIYF